MRFAVMLGAGLLAAGMAQAEVTEISVTSHAATLLSGTDVQLRLSDVQDVRCPSTVDCYWEGLIRVELQVKAPGAPAQTVVLCNACDGATRTGTAAGQTFTLLRLEPGREVLDPLSRLVMLADYTVVLAVE